MCLKAWKRGGCSVGWQGGALKNIYSAHPSKKALNAVRLVKE